MVLKIVAFLIIVKNPWHYIRITFLFYNFSHDHIEIISLNSELLFFKQRDSPYFPTLRLLHQCEWEHNHLFWQCTKFIEYTCFVIAVCKYFYLLDPFLLPHQQVDKGAIKFILSGANVMCPGLTSPGAELIEAEKNSIIVCLMSNCSPQWLITHLFTFNVYPVA